MDFKFEFQVYRFLMSKVFHKLKVFCKTWFYFATYNIKWLQLKTDMKKVLDNVLSCFAKNICSGACLCHLEGQMVGHVSYKSIGYSSMEIVQCLAYNNVYMILEFDVGVMHRFISPIQFDLWIGIQGLHQVGRI